jgi:uncharacterized protein YunC (DUF1805 family)
MNPTTISLPSGAAQGYVIPLGPANLVFALAKHGMLACGAIDVAVLDKFSYAAARVRRPDGKPVATLDDLLGAEVREANQAATALGVSVGMGGREALEKLGA